MEGEGEGASGFLSSLALPEADGEGEGEGASDFASSFLGSSLGFSSDFGGDAGFGGLADGCPEGMDVIDTSRSQVESIKK